MATIKIEDLPEGKDLTAEEKTGIFGGLYRVGFSSLSRVTKLNFGGGGVAAGCGCMGMPQDPGPSSLSFGIGGVAAGCGCMGMPQDPGPTTKLR